jgi:hypothetical protein
MVHIPCGNGRCGILLIARARLHDKQKEEKGGEHTTRALDQILLLLLLLLAPPHRALGFGINLNLKP